MPYEPTYETRDGFDPAIDIAALKIAHWIARLGGEYRTDRGLWIVGAPGRSDLLSLPDMKLKRAAALKATNVKRGFQSIEWAFWESEFRWHVLVAANGAMSAISNVYAMVTMIVDEENLLRGDLEHLAFEKASHER